MKPVTTLSAVFGSVVCHHRRTCSAKQADIAQHLGLSQSAYSRLECGKTPFTVPQLKMAADALRLSASHMLDQALEAQELLQARGIIVLDEEPGALRPDSVVIAGPVLQELVAPVLLQVKGKSPRARGGSAVRRT